MVVHGKMLVVDSRRGGLTPPGGKMKKGESAQCTAHRETLEETGLDLKPGELLKEEFLGPMNLSQYRVAKEIGVPAQRIGEIVAGRRSITADTDLRLCRFFGLSNGYWLRAQVAYDTEIAAERLSSELDSIVPWSATTPAS